jgi:hypothetical protein
VKIQGKIQGSFKPDDKVLATFIFVDHQPEAYGEETAIDIHNGTFSGRVVFDTYSSSFLGGDSCQRRPMSVLVRLIEADGVEVDRKSLKIATDFNYDEEHGEYTPKSDAILSGWCQPACDGTPVSVPTGWHVVDAGPFSISAPFEWEFHQLKGVDSYVGEFVGDGIVLTFDFGRYSDPLKRAKKPEYVVLDKSIAGFRARIVSPKIPGHGITGVYFPNVGGSAALCLLGHDLTSTQQQLVLKIFETFRFGGPVPRYFIPPPPAKNVQ